MEREASAEQTRIVEQRKKHSRYRLSAWNCRDPGDQRLGRPRTYAVATNVDDRRAARPIGMVVVRAVQHQRVMKAGFTRLQLDGDRLEPIALLGRQRRRDGVDV